MVCEDYPCCGHTSLDPCPRKDSKGRNIVTCCECGKRLSSKTHSSICTKCQKRMMSLEDREYLDYRNEE